MARMNRRQLLACATALTCLAIVGPASADKQKFPERSLSVNVNSATVDELMSLPGIGEKLASEIVRRRPYKRVEDLLRVKGIGEFKLGEIRPYVRLKGKTEPYTP